MTSKDLTLCMPVLLCLLFPSLVQGDDRDDEVASLERRLQLIQAESDLKMHELEIAVSEHEIEEAEVEVAKAKVNLASIQKRAGSGKEDLEDRIEFASLELKQAQIQATMKKLNAEMTRVHLGLAKARFDHVRAILSKTQERSPVKVRFEVVDDLDAIVIRGNKEGVEKIKLLMEKGKQE